MPEIRPCPRMFFYCFNNNKDSLNLSNSSLLSSHEILITNDRIPLCKTAQFFVLFVNAAVERLRESAEHESDFFQSSSVFILLVSRLASLTI